ncbi:hypothetical protein EVAR_88640_1 [Eumeta japonica]|uniref:Uncharacterized protein n=1 Tax=Eumeta variegata TaxID=151549 RepID=A0A4C1X020_EUMVA|nr:hypothetical protein EVAR_88640_1 [Eumeta japonica]
MAVVVHEFSPQPVISGPDRRQIRNDAGRMRIAGIDTTRSACRARLQPVGTRTGRRVGGSRRGKNPPNGIEIVVDKSHDAILIRRPKTPIAEKFVERYSGDVINSVNDFNYRSWRAKVATRPTRAEIIGSMRCVGATSTPEHQFAAVP